jgi:hypothetical protein
VALVLGQAHGQGAQAAQGEVGVVGAYGQAQGLVGGGDLFGQRGAVGLLERFLRSSWTSGVYLQCAGV